MGDWGTEATPGLRMLIAHLLFVERRVGLAYDDATEDHQRSSPLRFRQQIPQLVEANRSAGDWARGGAMALASLDMGHLLGPVLVELESIPPTAAGWTSGVLASLPISVKGKEWGACESSFL